MLTALAIIFVILMASWVIWGIAFFIWAVTATFSVLKWVVVVMIIYKLWQLLFD